MGTMIIVLKLLLVGFKLTTFYSSTSWQLSLLTKLLIMCLTNLTTGGEV